MVSDYKQNKSLSPETEYNLGGPGPIIIGSEFNSHTVGQVPAIIPPRRHPYFSAVHIRTYQFVRKTVGEMRKLLHFN